LDKNIIRFGGSTFHFDTIGTRMTRILADLHGFFGIHTQNLNKTKKIRANRDVSFLGYTFPADFADFLRRFHGFFALF
jgi:hypothetical protein